MKKQIVGLAVTPNLGLEALVFDKNDNSVVKYGQKFLEYNIASREIQDYNTLRSAIGDLLMNYKYKKKKLIFISHCQMSILALEALMTHQ